MAIDIFNTDAGVYGTAQERGLAADISKAFDNAEAMRERTRQRYGLPAAAASNRDMLLARAATTVDNLNRLRMNQISQARVDRAYSDQRRAQRYSAAMALIPQLLGRDGYQKLLNQGYIKYVTDAFGRVVATPDYDRWGRERGITMDNDGRVVAVGQDGVARAFDPRTGQVTEGVYGPPDPTATDVPEPIRPSTDAPVRFQNPTPNQVEPRPIQEPQVESLFGDPTLQPYQVQQSDAPVFDYGDSGTFNNESNPLFDLELPDWNT